MVSLKEWWKPDLETKDFKALKGKRLDKSEGIFEKSWIA
jgi:hypothetical protein